MKSAPRAWHRMRSCYSHPVSPAWDCFVVADLPQGSRGPNWLPTRLSMVKGGLNFLAQPLTAPA